MGTGLSSSDPTVVSAFHNALLHQGFVVVVLVAVVAVAWNVLRSVQLGRAVQPALAQPLDSTLAVVREPAGRRLLRITFGLLWIFDGILQGQASMPLGMGPGVIQPAAAASPTWVQHVVSSATTVWSYHPVSAAAAAVWIQVGIGVWLLVGPRGNWSRVGGVVSAGWGILVWIFGEAFGGIFAPGLTWMFGAPGAVLFYCVAGALIALPERAWLSRKMGRAVLAGMGLFFSAMAVLQAWPGRGFWQGQGSHQATPGSLTSMVQQMAQTPQPHVLSSWVAAFEQFDAAHGWAVNLFVVVVLLAIGAAFLSALLPRTGVPRAARAGVIAGVVVCLADWVLVEDFGFLGGVGTDPNSMIPMALVFIAGYLAVSRAPAVASELGPAIAAASSVDRRRRWAADPSYAFRSVASLAAIGILLVGATPMALAATRPNADPILTRAIDGPLTSTDKPAPAFDLVDQRGEAVTLASLRGKAVALTFLDPVCTSTCPVIAQEFRLADRVLGRVASQVELVAIDANPRYLGADYLDAFDQQEGLGQVTNWHYLTGTRPQLEAVWRAFGIEVAYEPGGAMIDHSEYAFVIDPAGRTRYVIDSDPGPGTEATQSSFTVTLATALKDTMGRS